MSWKAESKVQIAADHLFSLMLMCWCDATIVRPSSVDQAQGEGGVAGVLAPGPGADGRPPVAAAPGHVVIHRAAEQHLLHVGLNESQF